jgi:hypothetical protein
MVPIRSNFSNMIASHMKSKDLLVSLTCDGSFQARNFFSGVNPKPPLTLRESTHFPHYPGVYQIGEV